MAETAPGIAPTTVPNTAPEGRLGPDFRPLYTQVRDLIVGRVTDGTWKAGELLPSEMRLAVEFGVSQGTVRKALDELEAQNLIVRRQGKGTFIATHSPQRALFHFFHLVADDGERQLPISHGIELSRGRATREEERRLDLAAGARVVRIERVRDFDGRPVIKELIVIGAAAFPKFGRAGDLPNTLYTLYEERYGVIIHRAVEHLRAVAATADDARDLDVAKGAPLLEIDRLALSPDGRPVEWRVSRCDTENHRYLSNLE
jgi:GntR family transcriptional regulator